MGPAPRLPLRTRRTLAATGRRRRKRCPAVRLSALDRPAVGREANRTDEGKPWGYGAGSVPAALGYQPAARSTGCDGAGDPHFGSAAADSGGERRATPVQRRDPDAQPGGSSGGGGTL